MLKRYLLVGTAAMSVLPSIGMAQEYVPPAGYTKSTGQEYVPPAGYTKSIIPVSDSKIIENPPPKKEEISTAKENQTNTPCNSPEVEQALEDIILYHGIDLFKKYGQTGPMFYQTLLFKKHIDLVRSRYPNIDFNKRDRMVYSLNVTEHVPFDISNIKTTMVLGPNPLYSNQSSCSATVTFNPASDKTSGVSKENSFTPSSIYIAYTINGTYVQLN